METLSRRMILNFSLLGTGLVMILSGLVIQFKFHIGHHGLPIAGDLAFGLSYSAWAVVHKVSILIVTVLVLIHFVQHVKWYKAIIAKGLLSKNKQTIFLSVMFLIVAVTGYIPWLVHLADGSEMLRKVIIEIHDKLALILSIYLVLHIAQRLKWYISALGKLKSK
jgi:hypothetical protein